jgi:hypothetical protein
MAKKRWDITKTPSTLNVEFISAYVMAETIEEAALTALEGLKYVIVEHDNPTSRSEPK